MKMSDILRKIADIADAESVSANNTASRTRPGEVESPEDVEGAVMIPPLQAKLEILKKSNGMPNVYGQDESDELTKIKKNAGINTTHAIDDEPADM
jgi:hypothetical protein